MDTHLPGRRDFLTGAAAATAALGANGAFAQLKLPGRRAGADRPAPDDARDRHFSRSSRRRMVTDLSIWRATRSKIKTVVSDAQRPSGRTAALRGCAAGGAI